MPLIRIPSEDAGVEVLIYKEEAPAVALHILEQCGYGRADAYTGAAIGALRRLAEKQAEAADNQKLSDEAKALYKAAYGSDTGFQSYIAQEFWGAVAKKARELHKGEAK